MYVTLKLQYNSNRIRRQKADQVKVPTLEEIERVTQAISESLQNKLPQTQATKFRTKTT